jgi:hypothetical protein
MGRVCPRNSLADFAFGICIHCPPHFSFTGYAADTTLDRLSYDSTIVPWVHKLIVQPSMDYYVKLIFVWKFVSGNSRFANWKHYPRPTAPPCYLIGMNTKRYVCWFVHPVH